MTAATTPPGLIEAVPTPDVVRRELIGLAKRITLTRELLDLSERIDGVNPAPQAGADAGPSRKAGANGPR